MSDYIPQEIQLHILTLFPVKTLLRFRCVSKWWKQLIDSPAFLLDHLSVQNPRFLFQSQCENQEQELFVVDPRTLPSVDALTPPFLDEFEDKFTLFGTHHGVVCLYYDAADIVLWNPSIRKFFSLPLAEFFISSFGNSSGNCYGFWIDPSNKEYKIILLCFYVDEEDEPDEVQGFLYSSIRRDWSDIPPAKVRRIWEPFLQGPPLMMGGVAHWLGRHRSSDDDQGLEYDSKVIMSFDFEQESFEFIEIPNLKDMHSRTLRLFQRQGALSVVCRPGSNAHRCDIYSMQEGSWVHMFCSYLFAFTAYAVCPLEMEERGRALVKERDDAVGAELELYDTKAGHIPWASSFANVTHDFVESLLFPLE